MAGFERELQVPEFAERLQRLLSKAQAALALRAVAVVELASQEGTLSPWWRASAPLQEPAPEIPSELFDNPGNSSESAEQFVLPGAFGGYKFESLRLDVRPKLTSRPDALLLYATSPETPAEQISELRSCLEAGLSEDRRERLARAVFAAVDQGPDPFELTDRDARAFYVNTAWEQAFGYPKTAVLGRTVGSLLRDAQKPLHDSAFYQFTLATLREGKPWLGSLACRKQDGERAFVEVHVKPFSAPGTAFQGHAALRRETSHRAERDHALAVSHSEFRSVLSSISDGVVVLRNDRIYFANAAFKTMVGKQEQQVIGRPYLEFIHPDDRAQFELEHKTQLTRVRFTRAGGVTRFAEISPGGAVSFEAKPAMILLSRDTTDYRLTQRRLAHSEKLSELGSLAAGIAHEINNPLAYLQLNLEQVRADPQSTPAQLALIDEAIEGSKRIRNIVSELPTLSASDEPGELEPVDLTKAITSATNIAYNQIRHRARLVRNTEQGVFVLAREGPLVQVLLNVLVNAAQAIPTRTEIGEHRVRIATKRIPQDRIEVVISDTGVGISEAALPIAFEPFSTSKRRGEGSGLGLAISKRIMDEFEGSIKLESQLGQGTTVTIQLRAAEESGASAQSAVGPSPESAHSSGPRLSVTARRARILLVDDEQALARGLKRALLPHETVTIADGRSALEMIAQDSDFDLVLCDLMMPGMSGSEFYEATCRAAPTLADRFMFMTGGAFTEKSRAFLQESNIEVLRKPFDVTLVFERLKRTSTPEPAHGRAKC